MLAQIQNAGFAPPNLYRLDPVSGDVITVAENIDCGRVNSLEINKGTTLIIKCEQRLMSQSHEVRVSF